MDDSRSPPLFTNQRSRHTHHGKEYSYATWCHITYSLTYIYINIYIYCKRVAKKDKGQYSFLCSTFIMLSTRVGNSLYRSFPLRSLLFCSCFSLKNSDCERLTSSLFKESNRARLALVALLKRAI